MEEIQLVVFSENEFEFPGNFSKIAFSLYTTYHVLDAMHKNKEMSERLCVCWNLSIEISMEEVQQVLYVGNEIRMSRKTKKTWTFWQIWLTTSSMQGTQEEVKMLQIILQLVFCNLLERIPSVVLEKTPMSSEKNHFHMLSSVYSAHQVFHVRNPM